MSIGRKVWDKVLNRFIMEFNCTLTCDELTTDELLTVWDLETLERLLETQINHENYEAAAIIKKHIDIKNKECKHQQERK